MVSLQSVRSHNATLKSYGPGLVAVFVGGTSGVGETTARAFVSHTVSPTVYLVGRNETQASKIIEELRALNPDGNIKFVKSDISLLRNVDDACLEIQKSEEKINLLFLSPGIFTTKGRDETTEGLDKKFALHYYSRMRFITNLLPQLKSAASSPSTEATQQNLPPLSRVVSVLAAGSEGPLIEDDLSLKQNFSLKKCADHAITMSSLAITELAASNPSVSFVHTYPGVVQTGLMRGFNKVVQMGMSALFFIARPWLVPLQESGERHLYAGTFPGFAAKEKAGSLAGSSDVAIGSDKVKGSGGYLLNENNAVVGNEKVLGGYRESGLGAMVWQHTLDVFDNIRGKGEKY